MVRSKTTGNSHNKNSSTYLSKRSCPTSTLSSSSQKSILDMLPKKKKKPDTCKSNNIKGENFSLGSNPSSANQQSISNVVCQTNQNESSDSSPDTENENEDENQNEEFIQTSTGLNQREQCYSKYVKFRLSERFHFHLHFVHLAKMVPCVSYAQNMGKGVIFGDLKQ